MVVPILSSILMGVSITNHPFWGTTILGNPLINIPKSQKTEKAHETNVSWKPVTMGKLQWLEQKTSHQVFSSHSMLFVLFLWGRWEGETCIINRLSLRLKGLWVNDHYISISHILDIALFNTCDLHF